MDASTRRQLSAPPRPAPEPAGSVRGPCGLPSQLDGHRAGLLRHPAGGTPFSHGGVAPGRFLCPLTTWQLEPHGVRSVGVITGSSPDLIAIERQLCTFQSHCVTPAETTL